MRFFAFTGAVIGWFAIVLQLYLIIENRVLSLSATLVQFFSFFTILTNILVAVSFSFLISRGANTFFKRPAVLTAVAVYILVVGVVYNLVLRQLWSPQGWQRVADELLHSVVPVFYLLFWVVFVNKNSLSYRDIRGWLLYPLIYLVYILCRGALTGLYPYPFVDAANIGYAKTFLNSGVVCVCFVLLSALFVAVGKLMSRNKLLYKK